MTELKPAKWVAGKKRSKQYYALRKDMYWRLSSKTREPVEAMKQAFGDELDVVTMLALEPKPIDRDWTRFEESLEIIDLGRNAKRAEEIVYRLNAEAREEGHLRDRAAHSIIEKVRHWLSPDGRPGVAQAIAFLQGAHSAFAALTKIDFGADLAWTACRHAMKQTSSSHDKDDQLLAALKRARRNLVDGKAKHQIGDRWSRKTIEELAAGMIKSDSYAGAVQVVDNHIETVNDVLEARKEMADRKAAWEAAKAAEAAKAEEGATAPAEDDEAHTGAEGAPGEGA
jgi:hypothetical protein